MCQSRSVSMTVSMLLARPETAGLDHPGERDNVGQVFHGQLPSRLESIICPQLVVSKPWDTRVAWSLWPARDARGLTYTYGFVGIRRRRRAAPEGHQLGG